MQNIEIIKPYKKIIKFEDGFECEGNIVFVTGKDYHLSMYGDGNNSWLDEKINKDPNPYNVGMLKGELSAQQLGRFGETAFSLITGLEKNWEYKKNGDSGIDFEFEGKTIDIKTQGSKYPQHFSYVMGENYNGYKKELKSDIFVFCFTDKKYHDHENFVIPICFVGWQTLDFVISKPLEKSFSNKSKHKNYYIQYSEMINMDVLLDSIFKRNY